MIQDNKHISTISKNYAKALSDSAGKDFMSIKSQFEDVLNVIKSSNDLQIVMGNYSITVNKKFAILEEVFKGKIDDKLFYLLKILVEKNRLNEIFSIFEVYSKIIDERSNKKTVQIVSSVKLNTELKNRIIDKLQQKLNCGVKPDWQVDKNIIAGLEFKFDDYVIDSSVRTKLKNLGKNISR